ncbi:MAG: hypothetical protein AB7P22_14435 [Vicinamibacterales bacterium]
MTLKQILSAAAVALTVVGFAQSPANGQSSPQTITGYLVDVMCATGHASEGAAFGAKHDKACLLMDSCVKSGYSVLTAENKVVKLDPKGNELALALIKGTDRENDWRVSVTGTVTNDTITVTTLSLQ